MMGEDVWIVVCRHFHGAVGPIPTEAMARRLAAVASQAGGCTYQAVQLRIVGGRGDVGSERVTSTVEQVTGGAGTVVPALGERAGRCVPLNRAETIGSATDELR
jgi:hypothetical protein